MLTLASQKIQERMQSITEKTLCCFGCGGGTMGNGKLQASSSASAIYVFDKSTNTTYTRGKLLGKGGFAKCYELTDIKTRKLYAGKIIAKARLMKKSQKDKIMSEIELHQKLDHPNVVGFHSYFEDSDSIYIVLELCNRQSLLHVLKVRRTLTEPEVRYYLRQLIEGCRYIHSLSIVHRDLKLANMLLDANMCVKIADFGLATQLEYEGEKKLTICGTPNYIAPEVLKKKGHSYEADIWAIGCVMYAMLLGRPPFETATLKETYLRIVSNSYFIPDHVSRAARALIQRLLWQDPGRRPMLEELLEDEFFSNGYTPESLPPSSCEKRPVFSDALLQQQQSRRRQHSVSPQVLEGNAKARAREQEMWQAAHGPSSLRRSLRRSNPKLDRAVRSVSSMDSGGSSRRSGGGDSFKSASGAMRNDSIFRENRGRSGGSEGKEQVQRNGGSEKPGNPKVTTKKSSEGGNGMKNNSSGGKTMVGVGLPAKQEKVVRPEAGSKTEKGGGKKTAMENGKDSKGGGKVNNNPPQGGKKLGEISEKTAAGKSRESVATAGMFTSNDNSGKDGLVENRKIAKENLAGKGKENAAPRITVDKETVNDEKKVSNKNENTTVKKSNAVAKKESEQTKTKKKKVPTATLR